MISSCTSLSHMERIVKTPTRSPMCKFSAADGGGTSDRFSTFFKWKKPTAKFRIDIRNSFHFVVLLRSQDTNTMQIYCHYRCRPRTHRKNPHYMSALANHYPEERLL